MKSFDTWTYEQVEDAFAILPIKPNAAFNNWLNAGDNMPNTAEKGLLDYYRDLLFEEVRNWNDDELIFFHWTCFRLNPFQNGLF